MKLKKLICAALAAALTLSLSAGMTSCGSDAKYKVGICQLTQHPALDAATEGFKAALTDKLGKDVAFDYQNAQNDSPTCGVIANKFVSSNVDLIMANATPALQAAAAATDKIPIVATSITDYGTALEMEFEGKTGRNITGTADLAPLVDQAAMVKELCPDAKTVGLVYCSGEANSKYQVNIVKAELEKLGFATKEYASADSNDLSAVVTSACKDCDVLYIPTDNTIANAASIVDGIATPAGIPVICGEEGICKGCGIATLSIDYYNIGYNAGLMAYEILVNGANPAEMDIQFDKSPVKKYHASRCEKLGITVPDGYEAIDETAE
ncbi:MAG: ABC transporter substrate-binding protein [Clostridiales bacterium]|nr:ABC transporter substrate-binding protein [Clostridiales bacterium]